MMRRFSILLVLTALLGACAPCKHAVQVEMRYPSKSGIELAGKIISVVYVTDTDSIADSFNASMAESFASELENDYGTGEGSIGVYSLKDNGGRYSQKDTLVSLLMETGADAVFLFDKVAVTKVGETMARFNIKLYCFDAMNQAENVYAFAGNTVATLSSDKVIAEAKKAGETISYSFMSQWKHEQYSIVYYEIQKWYDALARAEAYDWKGAMDIWLGLLSTSDMMKRSSAEYNIAVACYMLGDYDLASEWLDRSDQDNELPLSAALRKRINTRKSAQ